MGLGFGNRDYGLNIELMTPAMAEQLQRLDAWWRAANYLAVGMIYLQDNPLLRIRCNLPISKVGCWGIGARARVNLLSGPMPTG